MNFGGNRVGRELRTGEPLSGRPSSQAHLKKKGAAVEGRLPNSIPLIGPSYQAFPFDEHPSS